MLYLRDNIVIYRDSIINKCSINLFQTFLQWKILQSMHENGIFNGRFGKQEIKIASTTFFLTNER